MHVLYFQYPLYWLSTNHYAGDIFLYTNIENRSDENLKTKSNVSVGIDGITCTVSGCTIQKEIKFPEDSDNPFLRIKPKGDTTEIAVILPRTIRDSNNVGFRVSDTKQLLDAVQKLNRVLKRTLGRDWSELFVRELEVAVTVDLGVVDELTIDSAMNFLANVLLRQDTPDKEGKKANKVHTKPIQKFVTGKKRNNCNFVYDEVTKSIETSLWSNRRLKFKAYSKGAFTEFGGNSSIFRLEGVYCEKGIRQVLGKKDDYITLQDVLTQRAIKGFIAQFKVDYTEIVAPRIRGYLNEAQQVVLETLEKTSAFNALLVNKDIVVDMRIYRKALKHYYRANNKSDGAYRKMLCSVAKKMQKEEVHISDGVISIFENIGTVINT